MLRRFHAMRMERDERGFTLIELLVVILIIAILAAIAIPVFLRQREKGWVSQMESALKNAATAQESCLTDEGCEGGNYTADEAKLVSEGLRYANDVTFVTITPDLANGYVMVVDHDKHSDCYEYDSAVGAPVVGTCP